VLRRRSTYKSVCNAFTSQNVLVRPQTVRAKAERNEKLRTAPRCPSLLSARWAFTSAQYLLEFLHPIIQLSMPCSNKAHLFPFPSDWCERRTILSRREWADTAAIQPTTARTSIHNCKTMRYFICAPPSSRAAGRLAQNQSCNRAGQ
jgi:hypothetical protein